MPPGYNMSWYCIHSLPPIPGGCSRCKQDPHPRCTCPDCSKHHEPHGTADHSATASSSLSHAQSESLERPARPAAYPSIARTASIKGESGSERPPPPLPSKRPVLDGHDAPSPASEQNIAAPGPAAALASSAVAAVAMALAADGKAKPPVVTRRMPEGSPGVQTNDRSIILPKATVPVGTSDASGKPTPPPPAVRVKPTVAVRPVHLLKEKEAFRVT